MVVKNILEIGCGPFVNDEHALAQALLLALLIGQLSFAYLDMIFLGQPSKGFRIGYLLVLHDKANRISSTPTTKAMAGAACRRNNERRSLFVVERAQPLIVAPRLAQGYKFGYYVNNVGRILNLLNGLLVYRHTTF